MNIGELRQKMGTNPNADVPLKTEFLEGVKGISVQLIDYPTNPYKAIVNMAASTWGSHIDKWPELSPEARFWIVKSVLSFKSLPNAMEAFSFSFAIENVSRSAFDQIARSRIGAVYASQGWRDNDRSDVGYRVPQSIWDNPESRVNFINNRLNEKEEYHRLIKLGQSSWQDARAGIAISSLHNFSMAFNYMALRNFCSNRLKFCEQSDTVATAWLVRERVKEKFPLLGKFLRPGCDYKGYCEYHQNNEMSEAFGCLFKECGRNICKAKDNYATFNYACSDVNTISEQLGIHIPAANEDMPTNLEFKDLDSEDSWLFIG